MSIQPSSNCKQLDSSYSEQRIQFTVQGTATVQTFAQQHKLTINNLVQATWALLLSRYSQETDVVFGATVSGRPPSLVGIESIVGIFINTLPVRVQVSADTELLTLLKDLQAQQVESEQYSYSSLVEIQVLAMSTEERLCLKVLLCLRIIQLMWQWNRPVTISP